MKKLYLAMACSLASYLFTSPALAGPDYNERQIKRLYDMAAHPERTGNRYRVLIVDGFRDVDVDRFLNNQFDNIQNVMFTSVIVTDNNGKPLRDKVTGRIKIEDDGC